MVNRITVLLVTLFFNTASFCQVDEYNVQIENVPFDTTASGETFLPKSWSGFNGVKKSLPFSFPFLDSTFNSVRYECTGRLIFDDNHHYYVDLFTMVSLEDAIISRHGNSTSKFTIDTLSEVKSVTFQVLNARLSANTKKSIDFQIQLFEDGSISYQAHFKEAFDIRYDLYYGPFTGVYRVKTFQPLTFFEGRNWLNIPNTQDTIFKGIVPDYLDYKLNSFIKSNDKIVMSPRSKVLGVKEKSQSKNCPRSISEIPEQQVVEVININGERIYNGEMSNLFRQVLNPELLIIKIESTCVLKAFIQE